MTTHSGANMGSPNFTKIVIAEVNNDVAPGPMNTFSTVGDFDGDGLLDVALCGRNGRMVWLQNHDEGRSWETHLIDEIDAIECGGSAHDLTGNGRPDIINGGDYRRDEMLWWENPGRPGARWQRRLVAKTGYTQMHDTLVGDVTNDGRVSLVFTNQNAPGGTNIYWLPLPRDPRVSPWPGLGLVARGMHEPNPYNPHRQDGIQPEEGLALGEFDGDGKNELVCGTHWYKYTGDGGQPWAAHKFAAGYLCPKIAIGDVDGDGRNEILLAEGDPCVYGKTQGGKVSWFKPGDDINGLWEEHVLEDYLLDAHSLQLGDLYGNGQLDILVGEAGMADPQTDDYSAGPAAHPPRLIVFENDGKANFRRHVIDEGTGIHEAVLADVWRRGVLDIVGKPLHGPEKWHVHVWRNNQAGTR
jgi:hypothetical protein